MSARTVLLLAAIAFSAAACGGGTDTTGANARPAAAPGRAAQQHKQKQASVFTPLTSTIDRAKGVQATVDKQAAEQRKRIDEESQ